MNMSDIKSSTGYALGLRAGEWVEVRSAEEILATLDARARLEALPFMPEMLKYCGKQLRVRKSAHKTCDTIDYQGARKLQGTVHLEGLRCDGEFHGGCQAGCTLFWKEAWLRRVDRRLGGESSAPVRTASPNWVSAELAVCTEQTLFDATSEPAQSGNAEGESVYRCQATELNRASTVLPWWDFRQYIEDVTTGNVSITRIGKAVLFWLFTKLLRIGPYRALLWTYDAIQKKRGGIPYPFKYGSCDKTPTEKLSLRPGELVQVKSQEEILRTVNRRNRNRGLSFDEEAVGFCGGNYRVLRRVERIINEKTGKMIQLGSDCIILDGVTCQSNFKHKRLFCPRDLYPYWREIWLKRVDENSQ